MDEGDVFFLFRGKERNKEKPLWRGELRIHCGIFNGTIDRLKRRHKTRKGIEMFVNSWSLAELLKDKSGISHDLNYSNEFARAVWFFGICA